jgi:hypothetical protein
MVTESLASQAVAEGPLIVQDREFPAVVSPFFLTVTCHVTPDEGALLTSAQIDLMVPAAFTS